MIQPVNGLSFNMPAGKLFSTESAPPDSLPIGQPAYQLPVIAPQSFGKTGKGKKFLSALFS